MNKILLIFCTVLLVFVSCNQTPRTKKISPLTYWDNKLDSLIIKQDRLLTEQAFSEFISSFTDSSEDTIQVSIERLMKECEKDPIFYMQMSLTAEQLLYMNNSPFMNESHYIHFLEVFQSSECLIEGYKLRYQKQLEACMKNRPGTQASNIKFIDAQGIENSLYNLDAKHILLVFYSPGCHQCMEVINEMKQNEQLNQWITSNEVKVLAMYTDGDKKEWVTQKDYFPQTWINGNDFDEDIYKKGTYILRMNPSIYLLDSDKKVLLKDTNMEDISKYFLSLHN